MKRNQGFSLFEILVCCAIVALIASIAFGAFASASHGAKRTVSISNLKQLHAALLLYENDWNDYPSVLNQRNPATGEMRNPAYETLIANYLGGVNLGAPVLNPNSGFSVNRYFPGYVVRGGYKLNPTAPKYEAAQACRENRGGEDPLVYDPNRQSTKIGAQEGERFWLVIRQQGNVEKIPFHKVFQFRLTKSDWLCPKAREIDNL